MVASNFYLAPHHLAPARFGREKHDEVIALANLRFNLSGPRLTDSQVLIDEHLVPGTREARKDVTREALVRLGVALVTEEHACSAEVHSVVAFHGASERFARNAASRMSSTGRWNVGCSLTDPAQREHTQ